MQDHEIFEINQILIFFGGGGFVVSLGSVQEICKNFK